MYAIIKTGGKQYRVEKDAIIDVELLDAPEKGNELTFKTIFVNDGSNTHVGAPEVDNFIVKAEIIGNSTGPKIRSMKYQPRENQRKKWGHRQHYTRLKITGIEGEEKSAPKKRATKETKAKENE